MLSLYETYQEIKNVEGLYFLAPLLCICAHKFYNSPQYICSFLFAKYVLDYPLQENFFLLTKEI